MAVMKASEFVAKLKDVAQNYKTLYVMGCFGAPLTGGNVSRYTGGGLASFVYERDHVVSELNGDRAVITYGGVTVAAVRVSDLTLVKE